MRGTSDALLNPRDVNAANFQAALMGFGGSGCDGGPAGQAPGQDGCRFFNPFSSNFSARPGDALFNGPELYDFIIGNYMGDGESRLTTVEANVTGDLPGYRGGYAIGAQYRDQSLDYSYDPVTRAGGGCSWLWESACRHSPFGALESLPGPTQRDVTANDHQCSGRGRSVGCPALVARACQAMSSRSGSSARARRTG